MDIPQGYQPSGQAPSVSSPQQSSGQAGQAPQTPQYQVPQQDFTEENPSLAKKIFNWKVLMVVVGVMLIGSGLYFYFSGSLTSRTTGWLNYDNTRLGINLSYPSEVTLSEKDLTAYCEPQYSPPGCFEISFNFPTGSIMKYMYGPVYDLVGGEKSVVAIDGTNYTLSSFESGQYILELGNNRQITFANIGGEEDMATFLNIVSTIQLSN